MQHKLKTMACSPHEEGLEIFEGFIGNYPHFVERKCLKDVETVPRTFMKCNQEPDLSPSHQDLLNYADLYDILAGYVSDNYLPHLVPKKDDYFQNIKEKLS